MKKILFFITMILLLLLLVSGCTANSSEGTTELEADEPIVEEEKTVIEKEKNTVDVSTIDLEKLLDEKFGRIEKEPVFDETKTYAKLTGLPIDPALENRRVFAIMFDNHYGARPQAGLSQADIVYEILAEGWITRYMGIFQSQYPENIGPVRSARDYFLDRALEYDAFYTHVGGSPKGLADIKRLNAYDIDAMSCRANTFWRIDYKKIPHNMYTSSEAIIKEAQRKNYALEDSIDFFNFYKKDTMLNGEKGRIIKITYMKPTSYDSVGYVSEFRYDENTGLYTRLVNGDEYIDENNKEVLTAKNILVQYTKHQVIDSVGRRKVDFVGTGKGLYFTNGEYIPVTWEKLSEKGRTKFYDASGEVIQLNRGNTWIQVVPTNFNVSIE
jgi:hypothetical protein